MTFTYDLTATGNSLTYSKLRLEIGDSIENSGVKPTNANFSDEELDLILDEEGSVVGRAAARCFEILANWWSRVADIAVGPRRESLSKVATDFAGRAREYRRQHGGGMGAYAYGLIKKDGYSDDVPSDDVTAGGEYGLEFEYVRPSRGG